MTSRRLVAAALGLALSGTALVGGHEHARAAAAAASAASADPVTGPREIPRSNAATLVTTFDALRALVADPNGPREIELAPGVYRGDLVVKRPVVLRGMKGAVLEGTGSGSVVTVDAKDVAIENVRIRRSGHRHTTEDAGVKAKGERVRVSDVDIEETLFGVSFEGCHGCILERSHITGYDDDTELRGDGIKLWEANDSIVRGCVVDRCRDVVVWYTKRATLEDNVVRHGRYGTHFMYAHDGVVRRSRVEGNVVGIFVMYSMRLRVEDNVLAGARGAAGMGLGFKDSDAVQVKRNWMVANTTGTYLDDTPRTPADPVVFEGNVVALNDVALRLHSSEEGLHLRGNDFRENAALIEVDGGNDALAVDVHGNHFSDYEGYDLNHDGIGDVAYEVKALSSELTESHPALKFFHGTAAMGVIDAVAHAVPVLAAKQLLVDPAPLVTFPEGKTP
jgi:nitrous oxidase accessory protein